jgi:hypothetical protein
VQKHNDPAGMIALCAQHADFADGGAYTLEQLREFKRNPYISEPRVSPGRLAWQRNELILLAGGFYLNPRVYLRANGRDMIWCTRDNDGFIMLNIDIRDANDCPIILMKNNDWLQVGAVDGIDDIEGPPLGRSLTVRAEERLELLFSIKFRERDQADLWRLGQDLKMRLDERPGPQEPIGPFAEASEEDLRRIIDNSKSDFERATMLQLARLNEDIRAMPSRWELLTRHIRWPITVCEVSLRCAYPFHISLSSTGENVGGWIAKHSIVIESDVVWNL